MPAIHTSVVTNCCDCSFFSLFELRVHIDRHSRHMASLILLLILTRNINTLCGMLRFLLPVKKIWCNLFSYFIRVLQYVLLLSYHCVLHLKSIPCVSCLENCVNDCCYHFLLLSKFPNLSLRLFYS